MATILEALFFLMGMIVVFLGAFRLCSPGNKKNIKASKSGNRLGAVMLIVLGFFLILIASTFYFLAYFRSLY